MECRLRGGLLEPERAWARRERYSCERHIGEPFIDERCIDDLNAKRGDAR